jgi:hypothetical protein
VADSFGCRAHGGMRDVETSSSKRRADFAPLAASLLEWLRQLRKYLQQEGQHYQASQRDGSKPPPD